MLEAILCVDQDSDESVKMVRWVAFRKDETSSVVNLP